MSNFRRMSLWADFDSKWPTPFIFGYVKKKRIIHFLLTYCTLIGLHNLGNIHIICLNFKSGFWDGWPIDYNSFGWHAYLQSIKSARSLPYLWHYDKIPVFISNHLVLLRHWLHENAVVPTCRLYFVVDSYTGFTSYTHLNTSHPQRPLCDCEICSSHTCPGQSVLLSSHAGHHSL